MDTRALGLAIVTLGGGRRRGGDAIDPRVGLAQVQPVGQPVAVGEPLAIVHAADAAAGQVAVRAVQQAIQIGDQAMPARRVCLATVAA
jgi:thymidine phosphorylase